MLGEGYVLVYPSIGLLGAILEAGRRSNGGEVFRLNLPGVAMKTGQMAISNIEGGLPEPINPRGGQFAHTMISRLHRRSSS